MASRFRQGDSRSSLFSSFDNAQSHSQPASASASPAPRSGSRNTYSTYHANNSSPYNLGAQDGAASAGPAFGAYPGSSGEVTRRSGDGGFRPATPNRKGQYSDAALDELESQNDEQVGVMAEKVRQLKNITIAIGDEIRDSTAFAEKMNESFEGTRNRLRGTMNRMLRMAERTGIGWRVWVGFFAALVVLFWYVWLF